MGSIKVDLSEYFPPIPEHVEIYKLEGYELIKYVILGDLIFWASTKYWCGECGFDEETTMFWLLKYGDMLPETINQL